MSFGLTGLCHLLCQAKAETRICRSIWAEDQGFENVGCSGTRVFGSISFPSPVFHSISNCRNLTMFPDIVEDS